MRVPTEIGSDFRERATEPERLEAAIASERKELEHLERQLDAEPNDLERTRLGRTLNRLGEHLRLAGDYDEARRCCDRATQIWEEFGRDRAAFLARLRRAEVDLGRGEYDEALERADDLVRRSGEAPYEIYRDFALEFRGRVHAAADRRERAREDLRGALGLRRDRGRQRLVDRTERLLRRLEPQ